VLIPDLLGTRDYREQMRRTVMVLSLACLLGIGVAACGDTTPPADSAASPRAPATTAPPAPADPWELSIEGIGPYRLGERIDTMPAGVFTGSEPRDLVHCPGLVDKQATGLYAGALLFVVRDNVLVQIFSAGGDPGVHTPLGDRVGSSWSSLESAYPPERPSLPGRWRTAPDGDRAFVVTSHDRVYMFSINPIRPKAVGGVTVGLADYTLATFLNGQPC
jgi:hypothetical protein